MLGLLHVLALALPLTTSPAAPAPTTRPAPATLTPEQSLELQTQAYQFMLKGDYAKAAKPLELVYKLTPPDQRTRPLVLNHAIVDMAQKRNIMRALVDLRDYLTKHRAEDEFATDVLGAALNLAVDDYGKKTELWQTALKEWDRRNYAMDHSRAGWRRWGTRWVSEDDTKARQAQAAELRRAIDDQAAYVERVVNDAYSLAVMQNNALKTQSVYNQTRESTTALRSYLQQVGKYQKDFGQWQQKYGKTAPQTPIPALADPAQTPVDPNRVRALQGREGQLAEAEFQARMSAQSLGEDLVKAYREIATARAKMAQYQSQLRAIRPEWPERFDPVDPKELTPPPSTLPPTTRPVPDLGLPPPSTTKPAF